MSDVKERLDADPKWDALFDAQHHLFIAARHTLQAMTLRGEDRHTGSHERFAIDAMTQAATAMGFDLVKVESRS